MHLVGPLGAADYPLPSLILISYSLDMVVTKRIAYNKKNFHLQIGSCKCQYLGALGPNRHWTHPLVTSSPSNTFYFRAYEVSRWVESYLLDGLILSFMGSYTSRFITINWANDSLFIILGKLQALNLTLSDVILV